MTVSGFLALDCRSSLPHEIDSHVHFPLHFAGKVVLIVVRLFIIEIPCLEMEAHLNCS